MMYANYSWSVVARLNVVVFENNFKLKSVRKVVGLKIRSKIYGSDRRIIRDPANVSVELSCRFGFGKSNDLQSEVTSGGGIMDP